MSDWQATESTISAITGLDMTMPGDILFNSGDSYFGGNLTAYVNNGTIPEDRVDDMAIRYAPSYTLILTVYPHACVQNPSWVVLRWSGLRIPSDQL
jgi:hypothetical protein